jgi:hypothetical protein
MKIHKHSPFLPAKYDPSDSHAIRALMTGTASAGQQRQALDWIIHVLCRTYDEPYRPGEDGRRETDYALGMAYVGRQLVKHANGVPANSSAPERPCQSSAFAGVDPAISKSWSGLGPEDRDDSALQEHDQHRRQNGDEHDVDEFDRLHALVAAFGARADLDDPELHLAGSVRRHFRGDLQFDVELGELERERPIALRIVRAGLEFAPQPFKKRRETDSAFVRHDRTPRYCTQVYGSGFALASRGLDFAARRYSASHFAARPFTTAMACAGIGF